MRLGASLLVWQATGLAISIKAWQPRHQKLSSSSSPLTAAFRTRTTTASATTTTTTTTTRINPHSADNNDIMMETNALSSQTRRSLLTMAPSAAMMGQLGLVLLLTTTTTTSTPTAATAFDGGVGGLGKTRPETGVVFVSPPVQDTTTGVVRAELLVDDQRGTVAAVSLAAPWQLLVTSTGLEVRDLSTSDAAFCQVVRGSLASSSSTTTPKQAAAQLQTLLAASVLAPQGKFGMYGAPSSIKVKPVPDEPAIYQLSFTTLTPGMRESDRVYYVSVPSLVVADDTLVLLLTGSTAQRFASQRAVLYKVAKSWQVTEAPKRAVIRR